MITRTTSTIRTRIRTVQPLWVKRNWPGGAVGYQHGTMEPRQGIVDQSASCNESYIENLRKSASQPIRPLHKCTALFLKNCVLGHVSYSFWGHSSEYRSDLSWVSHHDYLRFEGSMRNGPSRPRKKNKEQDEKSVSALVYSDLEHSHLRQAL
jgi:hypothetical protein